jgi:hypothetical protein
MTLSELAATAAAMFPSERAPSRGKFAALMNRFPDVEAETLLPQPLPTRGRAGG